MKQTLDRTAPKVRHADTADLWAWLITTAHTHLRLARPLPKTCATPGRGPPTPSAPPPPTCGRHIATSARRQPVRQPHRSRPTQDSASYAVEAMVRAPHSHELIVGVRRDPSFGPIVMVGTGGVTAELAADTAVALAPLTHGHAKRLLLRLRHAQLLTGWRGVPAVNLDAAARAAQAVAQAPAEHGELTALEVNPLLVHPHGATALDAHGVLSTGDSGSVLH